MAKTWWNIKPKRRFEIKVSEKTSFWRQRRALQREFAGFVESWGWSGRRYRLWDVGISGLGFEIESFCCFRKSVKFRGWQVWAFGTSLWRQELVEIWHVLLFYYLCRRKCQTDNFQECLATRNPTPLIFRIICFIAGVNDYLMKSHRKWTPKRLERKFLAHNDDISVLIPG